MGSLSHVQQAVATIRAAVGQCRSQYRALATWVARDDKYLTEMTQAHKSKKPTGGIPRPGLQPPGPGPMCQPPQAFGIAPGALSPDPRRALAMTSTGPLTNRPDPARPPMSSITAPPPAADPTTPLVPVAPGRRAPS